MSVRLYVGNLPKELDRKELEALFATEVGDIGSTKVVTDRKTGKCRGFGFVTVETNEQADQVIEKLNGHLFRDNALKIEKALPRDKAKEDAKPSEANETSAEERPAASANRNRRNKNKSRRSPTSTSTSSSSDEFQPDPRWANQLEQLKQMLVAQSGNS